MSKRYPWVLNSSLFLLLLLLHMSLLRAQDLTDIESDWTNHNPYYPISGRIFGNIMGINTNDENILQYCDGAFDVYYVLDISKTNTNWPAVYAAWEDMVEKYVNPNLRVSYILYATEASVKMTLNSNRNTMRDQMTLLQYNPPVGETFLQEGLKKANAQIQDANSGDTKVSSMIITLVSGPLQPKAFQESKEEANKARGMGAYIYCIGMDSYKLNQLQEIADSPDHILEVKQAPTELHELVDMFGTKTCLELRSVEPPFLCVDGSDPVILKGYGFNNGKSKDQIICRFNFSGTKVIESHPIAMNMTSLTCPKPEVQQPGETVTIEVSLNNGRNFLARPVTVNTTSDCTLPPETSVVSEYPTYPPETTPSTGKTTRPQTTQPPKTTTSPPPETTTTQAVTPSPNYVYVEGPPTPEEKLLTLVLTLLLIPVILWWLWWLCCRKVEPPLPEPIKKPRKKPPPAPLPQPVNVCPTIIICCCACRGVCVNRGMQGNVTLRNLDRPCYHQVPPLREQSNLALMPSLYPQASCDSQICLWPTQDNLPITYCSQCHPLSARCYRPPSRTLRLLPPPATRRIVYSLPPP